MSGHPRRTTSDDQGVCNFHDLSTGAYRLRVVSVGFRPASLTIHVPQAAPRTIVLEIAGANASVDVVATADPLSANAETVTVSAMRRRPASQPARELIDVVRSQPGWLLEANGVLHPRGSEYDTQYVVDGIPVLENRSSAFAPPLDASAIATVRIETGGYPAAYGRKLGGVVEVDTLNHVMPGWHGSVEFDSGSFHADNVGVAAGFAARQNALNVDFNGARTNRFLDPPTIEALHDYGSTVGGGISFARDFSRYKRLRFNFRQGHSGLDVPNELEQEVAGQRQSRELGDVSGSGWYQQIITPNLVFDAHTSFRRLGATLVANELSMPIVPFQDRDISEFYASGALDAHKGRHDFSFGSDFVATHVAENFRYRITVPSAFDPSVRAGFAFTGKADGKQAATYFQDRFSAGPVTLAAGLRYDYYQLLVSDGALSPRIAGALSIARLGVVLHGSYDRIFNTPATENLLLASSAAVREVNSSALRLPVPPARANFFEVGLEKAFLKKSRLDVSAYRRGFRNFHDDDVFLNTGVSFPISFASAMIEGIEAKLSVVLPHQIEIDGNLSNLSGIAQFPVTGGLFLEGDANALLGSTEKFRITQDQRNSANVSLHYQPLRQMWFVASTEYGSGLPVELEKDQRITNDPRILRRINFARGRLQPSYSVDTAIGATLWKKESRSIEGAVSATNITDHLNVINFAGLFSGTAIGAPRSLNGRIRVVF